VDFIAAILELVGLYIVGNKNRFGFILNISCAVFWIIYVLSSKSAYGILIVVVPSIIINIRNFLKWGNN